MPIDFPAQLDDVPFPGEAWPTGDVARGDVAYGVDGDRLEQLLDRASSQPDELGLTLATVVIHGGRLVAERYGPDTDADTTLISWSMAKSITHALFGLLADDGLVDITAPAPVAGWVDDERRGITVLDLLEMASGLHFVEDYVDAGTSHVIEMLFGAGIADHAAYAASFPLDHAPGTVFNYSSGTTNILARIAGDAIGGGRSGIESYLHERLFQPLGMASASPKFDDAGTFVGSSYVYATARDFARFGLLYLRNGWWGDRQLLPAGWSDHARTPARPVIPDDNSHGYGRHWWLWRRDPSILAACGYEGQRIIVDPGRDLVIVRLGKSDASLQPAYDDWLDAIRACFPEVIDG